MTRGKRKKEITSINTWIVLGSGGHTTEMLEMIQYLNPNIYRPMTFIMASTDETSQVRLDDKLQQQQLSCNNENIVVKIPRSRHVGQSYILSVFTTLYAIWHCFTRMLLLQYKRQPDLLICNGPGTCIPVVLAVFVSRCLGMAQGRIVFVESFCRVTSLSLSGKIMYHLFADLFIVHWKELRERYPHAHMISTFVNNNDTSGKDNK